MKFYVPVVLVVEGDSQALAVDHVHYVMDKLLDLRPEKIEGQAVPDGLAASPASDRWFERYQVLSSGNETVSVVEE